MSFERTLQQKTAYCDQVIEKYIPKVEEISGSDSHAVQVLEAMRYSLLSGGKRLRPLFIAETCAMYGGRQELAEPFMAALEMIHTYSLIHDDLPSMDNDEYRRGNKTCHIVYGEGMAILAGDGLLNFAYETAMRAFDIVKGKMESGNVIEALRLLAKNAGIWGMVGGQCADLEGEQDPGAVDADALWYVHKHKTACMIESGFQIGAIVAGAPAEDVEKLGKIAENIGVAFQIQDDILDVKGNSDELGKMVGSDEKDGKVTYVTLHGIDKAESDVSALTQEALELYDSLSAENDFLRKLIEELIMRTK